MKLWSRGRILAPLFAGVLALTFLSAPPAHAATGVTLHSLHNVAPIGQTVVATIQISPALPQVYVEAYAHVGSDYITVSDNRTDSHGRAQLSLDYNVMKVGVTKFSFGALIQGGWYYLHDIPVTRTPRITLLSAPGIAAPGQAVKARYGVDGGVGTLGFVDALVGSGWSRSQQVKMTSPAEFTINLTYGQNTPGLYTFRGGATVNGITGYATPFKLTRASLLLWSAPSALPVGTTGTVTGKVTVGPGSPTVGYLKVWHFNRFVTIRQAKIDSAGFFKAPLAYGVNTPDTYAFQLWYPINGRSLNVIFLIDRY